MAVLLVAPAAASAASRFVATGGGDTGNACLVEASPCLTIQHAVDQSDSGDTINVAAGTYEGSGQVTIDKDLTLTGAGKADTTLEPGFDTPSGDSWFSVTSGRTFDVNDLTLDGNGDAGPSPDPSANKVFIGIRYHGSAGGAIDSVGFTDISFGHPYIGIAVATNKGGAPEPASGDLDVINSTFSDIQRVGVLYKGVGVTGTFSGNTYTGKGDGDFLDYALDISAGADVEVTGNTVSANHGVASSDGSGSAAFLVTTFWGAGTQAQITENTLTDNTAGVYVGFDGADTSAVTAFGNRFAGNDDGVVTTAPTVDAENNWWGCNEGPTADGSNDCDSFSVSGTGDVHADPWLVLSSSANPTAIATDGDTSEITAAIDTNSDDQPADHAPDGTPVTFANTGVGSVAPAGADLTTGEAATTLTSGASEGTAHVGSTVDSATVNTNVAIGSTDRYVATDGDDTGNDCLTQASPCLTVGHAVGEANAGDTINLAAGNYNNGGVSVDTPDLTIAGAGETDTVVLGGANVLTLLGGADGLTVRDLKLAEGTGNGIYTDAAVDDVTLQDVGLLDNPSYGIEIHNNAVVDGWQLHDVIASGNSIGMRVRGAATNTQILDSTFDDNEFGLYSVANGTAPGTFDNVEVTNTSFDSNAQKGMYFEALSNAAFEDVSVQGSGTTSAFPAGVDINLKYGDFANVSFTDTVISDSTGVGLALKGRNDAPSYDTTPASLDNVDLEGLTVTGNDRGVELGNAVTNASVTGSRIVGNTTLGLKSYADNDPGPEIDATDNWWGCNGGPGAAGCDTVVVEPGMEPVDFDPWLVLTARAHRSTIVTGGDTAGITAAIDTNSDGDPAGPAPDGIPVDFTTTLGTVDPTAAELAAGQAKTTLTSGADAGTAQVTATVDSQAADATVDIESPTGPVNTAKPEITGDPEVGQPLSASEGTWAGDPDSFAYQWLRCDTGGNDCVNATGTGADSAHYTLVAADAGSRMRVTVTATNEAGSGVATSAKTSKVVALSSIDRPEITGDPEIGQTLHSDTGSWTDSPTTFVYQWVRCETGGGGHNCVEVAGDPGDPADYTLTAADVDHRIKVTVTATSVAGSADASSHKTPTVAALAATIRPEITGDPALGQTLQTDNGTWTGSPTGFAYQWLRCDTGGHNCVDVGTDANAYELTAGDVGHRMKVTVTATNAAGSAESTAPKTPKIAALSALDKPEISGGREVGDTLSTTNGIWTDSPTGFAYQWLRCDTNGRNCVDVGTDANQYELTTDDVGHRMNVAVTASNATGSATERASKTPAVLP